MRRTGSLATAHAHLQPQRLLLLTPLLSLLPLLQLGFGFELRLLCCCCCCKHEELDRQRGSSRMSPYEYACQHMVQTEHEVGLAQQESPRRCRADAHGQRG